MHLVPKILLNEALKKEELIDVKKHEERHYGDFKTRAHRLKSTLEQAILRRQDVQLDARMAWFQYDVDLDWNAYHRATGRSVKIVFPPNVPRPSP